MAGRYLLTSSADDVARHFDVVIDQAFPPRWNIAPSQPIAIVRTSELTKEREFALARWGFIPSWAREEFHERMGSRALAMARAETAAVKPTFRAAMKRRRCLLPADGFYEWVEEGGIKQPYRVEPKAGGLFAIAGIWETAYDPDGGEIDTAAILTVDVGPDLSSIHHREPVTIPPHDYEAWLDPDETVAPAATSLIAPPSAGFWTCYRVSTEMNDARREGADIAKPIDDKGTGSL